MMAMVKKLKGGRPAWMIVPAFFLAGAALVHLLINVRWDAGNAPNPLALFELVYTKVGWVSIPLTVTAIALAWASAQNVMALRRGEPLPARVVRVLEMVASLAPKLGLLGTVTGMITAMTLVIDGMSEFAAQALKTMAYGTALLSTAGGVSLSILAEVQIPYEKEEA